MSDPLNHLGPIWYHPEPSDVPYYSILKPSFLTGTFLPLLTAKRLQYLVHTDAFFQSQKETSTDITTDSFFEKFTSIQKTLFSCTFGTAWDKTSQSGLTFGHLREKKIDLKIIFFYEKTKFWSFYIKISVCSVVGLKNINVMCVRFI